MTTCLHPHDYLLHRASQYARAVDPPANGTRDNRLFNLAGNLRAFQLTSGETLSENEILNIVGDVNQRCLEPLAESEVKRLVHSAFIDNGTPREAKIVEMSEPGQVNNTPPAGVNDAPEPTDDIRPIPFAEFRHQYPTLHPPVVDGLLREGETANIISASKVGKSWLSNSLALSIATGRTWLHTFPCAQGRVLLIDNELHKPTIAHRIPKVADAMQIATGEYENAFDVISLRGRRITLRNIRPIIERIEAGQYKCIIVDAWYRMIPPGLNENSNADIMDLYNTLDGFAAHTRAAIVVIHHASKGVQAEKAVTDVGAGAGAQSRAADSHIVLRPHDEPGCVVMESTVRSFPPMEPIALRWAFPVWERDYAIDPTALKGRKSKGEERQDGRDREGLDKVRGVLTADAPLTLRGIRDRTGYGADRADRLLTLLIAAGEISTNTITHKGRDTREYTLAKNGNHEEV